MNSEQVKHVLSQYRELEASYRMQKSLLPDDDGGVTTMLRKKLDLLDAWMQIIPEESRFIITHRLLNGLPWPMISVEHEMRWGKAGGKSERTLKRYQAAAIKQIVTFIKQSGFEPHITVLFFGRGS